MAQILTINEIRNRAYKFSSDWQNASNERSEAQSFWKEFFKIFDINVNKVGTFEYFAKRLTKNYGWADCFWPGKIIIEHKSKGEDLEAAFTQALEYLNEIPENQLPKYIMVCDFENFHLYNLEDTNNVSKFTLLELPKNIHLFDFISGHERISLKEELPVNIKASELMGKLHDYLKSNGYVGHDLEILLVRLVFCLFADDSEIFYKDDFTFFIETRTKDDGSDLGSQLVQLFDILNTSEDTRYKNLDESLLRFPYVNGKLFEKSIKIPYFDSTGRKLLLDACYFNWSKVSPAIFGSMFQSVMNATERRNLGAHYTSEKNILKLIEPLFLSDLKEKLEKIKNNDRDLKKLHKELAELTFLDPACGCGNFLIIAYRELRLLEIEVLKILQRHGQLELNILDLIKVNVNQFYGIEIEEFPAKISEVAMWLMDHLMNRIASIEFGEHYARVPLVASATILNDNALKVDWPQLIPQDRLSFILGNPPFIGKSLQSSSQKKDLEKIFQGVKGAGVLDYVTAWYIKASQFIQNTNIKVAFVSTNSISQGEQVGILWHELFNKYYIKIHFAHNTFKWQNEAKGNAGVHVVIIGFANFDSNFKYIFEYDNVQGDPVKIKVSNINPYLVEGRDIWITKLRKPLCNVPEMNYGSMPNDGGNLLMNQQEMNDLLLKCPAAKKYIKKFVMGDELINNIPRYCLWLDKISPEELRNLPMVKERVDAVKKLRESSSRQATQELALYPTRFGEVRQPNCKYIAIPRVSSENRKYIPIAILEPSVIAGDKVYTIANSSLYYFGVLTSTMHMEWMRLTAGRLESRYSYSNSITYNNFPWPEKASDKNIQAIEIAAQKILDTRLEFPESSLADLYDPSAMPPKLTKAHQDLDKAVDKAYRSQPFRNDSNRMEFLFNLYEKYTNPIIVEEKTINKKSKIKSK